MKYWFIGLVLALFFIEANAQDGPSSIRIEGPNGRGSFTCYAHACMDDSAQEKQSRLRNLQNIVEQDCNARSSTFRQERCDKARDEHAAARSCYADYCSRATCRTSDYSSKKCISSRYFADR